MNIIRKNKTSKENKNNKTPLQNRVQKAEWDYIKNLPYLIFGYVARSEAREDYNSPVKGVIQWSIQNISMKEFKFQLFLLSPKGEKESYFVELFQKAWDRENFYILTKEAIIDALDPYEDGEDEKLTGMVKILKRELNEHEYFHFCVELFTFIIELGCDFNERPEDQMENLFSQQERDVRLLQRIFNFYL